MKEKKIMKNAKKLLALAAMASMLMMTACGGSKPAAPADSNASSQPAATEAAKEEAPVEAGASISQSQDIVIGMNVDFTTMDPQDTSDTISGAVQKMMLDSLFAFDENMVIYPMLATGYEANDEATEFTINLREGISFTDGTPWNADALLTNIEKWDTVELGLKRSTFLSSLIDTYEKVDDYTVKINLTSPFGAFIANLAHPACTIMSPKTIEAGVEECALRPVGTGQYTFVEWEEGDHLTIALNKDWWGFDAEICGGEALADSDCGFNTVTFRPVEESATRVAMIQSGDAQIIEPIPTESVAVLQNDPNVKVSVENSIIVRYLFMNNQKEQFKDVRVRQAIDYAIDKNAYCAVVKDGLAVPATSVIGENVAYYKGNEPREYNIEKAKELLAEAGYPDGFTCTLTYTNTTANQKQCEFIKQQLEQVGITVELNGLESAICNELVQAAYDSGADSPVELYVIGWSPSTGDADWGIRPLLAIESEPPMSYNICYYENEELDGYIQQGLQSADVNVRAEAYANAQDLVWEDVPLVCLAQDSNTWATAANISGVFLNPDGALIIQDAKMTAE